MANTFSNITAVQKAPITVPPKKTEEQEASSPKASEANASMALSDSKIGVVQPSEDIYHPNLMQDVNERLEKIEENAHGEGEAHGEGHGSKPLSASSILGAAGLQGEGKKGLGFWGNLIIFAGLAAGGYMGFKKIQASIISSIGISTFKGIEDHLAELIKITEKRKLVSKDFKSATIRTIGDTADNIRKTLLASIEIAREARNSDNLIPTVDIRFKQGAEAAAKAVRNAWEKDGAQIATLSDDQLQSIEYVMMHYGVKATGNNTRIVTPVSKLESTTLSEVTSPSKFFQFLGNLFS